MGPMKDTAAAGALLSAAGASAVVRRVLLLTLLLLLSAALALAVRDQGIRYCLLLPPADASAGKPHLVRLTAQAPTRSRHQRQNVGQVPRAKAAALQYTDSAPPRTQIASLPCV